MKSLFIFCFFVSSISFAAIPPSNTKNRMTIKQHGEYGDHIKSAFSDENDMKTRWKSLMAAAQLGQDRATPDLLKASKDSQWFMRTASMMALAEYNPDESMKVARKLIKDKALVVRSAAVDVLAKNMDAEVRALFWKELKQKYNFKNKYSLWIRPQIVTVLAEKPQVDEISAFKALLQERNLNIQLSAIQGLEKLTGVKLGDKKTSPTQLVKLWQEHKVSL